MKKILKSFSKILPDALFLKIKFYFKLHYRLNLRNPKTLNEKLQWLKLYDHNPIYSTMVDKVSAKTYVKKIIGEKYIIPTLGVYDDWSFIDFHKLPLKFVIKCTHDSGGVIICNDKNKLDYKQSKKTIESSLKRNYFYDNREWPYKNIKPRIIVEKYIGDNINDYKIQCFNGNVDSIFVCEGRNNSDGVRYYYFDKDWNYLNYCNYSDIDFEHLKTLKPKHLNEMIEISKKLSHGFTQLRVDLYEINDKIYFGELTLYTNAGFDTTISRKADNEMGSRLVIDMDVRK